MEYFIFFVTVPNMEEGKKIARILVEDKLAACVNIINNIYSIYSWKDNVEEDTECLLIIKTTDDKVNSIIQEIKKIHSYDEPECIGLKIEKGSDTYLKWIED
ncbi:MAG: divalent-cation tolerance protein CutA, partial [Candidatus Hodarchaeota archaeon]